MNNANKEIRTGKLEQLSEEVQTWIIEVAMNSRLADTVLALKQEGIEVSVPTLSRFVRKDREKQLIAEGEEMKESAMALATRGKESAFRARGLWRQCGSGCMIARW